MGQRINDLIEAALLDGAEGAMTKVAQEAEGGGKCEKCGKSTNPGSKLCKECAEKAARSEEQSAGMEESEKTSSARIYKLAEAVSFIADNFHNIQPPVGVLKTAEPAAATTPESAGPGGGPTAIVTDRNSPPGGGETAPEGFGEAKSKKPPMTPNLERGATPKSAPNHMETDASTPPGGPGMQPQMIQEGGTGGSKPQAGAKTASAVHAIKRAMMRKRAAENDGTSISTSKTMLPTTPENQQSGVERPAEVTSQERLIASNEAAINATKRQAKEVPKKRMGDVLSEPAQSKSVDSVLDKALGSGTVNQAGAKIAAAKARVLLQKTASAGCTCNGAGTCGYCKLASRVSHRNTGNAGALWAEGRMPGSGR